MSRYLTPSKIALLALTSLYAESLVPSAATIPILSFLVSHLLPFNSHTSTEVPSESGRNLSIPVDSLQQNTITHPSVIPGRTLWDLLLKKLWEIDSFGSLHVFFDTLSQILDESSEGEDTNGSGAPKSTHLLLSRSSPLGAFVRRCQLEFTRLQFDDGVTLWKSLVEYTSPPFAVGRRRHPGRRASLDINLHEGKKASEKRIKDLIYGDMHQTSLNDGTTSTEDVKKLLKYQVNQKQKMGNRLPVEMKAQLRKTGVTVPSLSHYVEFLDAWKAGDYPTSFDNLHRYFDYTMHHKDRTSYQYALLNLAILQAEFGSLSEAVVAMQEAISTARENDDTGCLNYSLSWLYHFGREHPEELAEIHRSGVLGTEREALGFLKAKAKESEMWSLLSATLLSEARLGLSRGESVVLAFENITKASHLNITKDVGDMAGSLMAMQSSLFGRLGVSCEASLFQDIFIQCYAAQSPCDDIIRSTCKSASLLALKGQYEEALIRMEGVDHEPLRTLKYYHRWATCMGLLKLQNHIHRDHLIAADHVLSQIKAGQKVEPDLSFDISILEIHLHMQRNDYSTAMDMLESLAIKFDSPGTDTLQRVKLMTLKARIYDRAGIPQKGFSVAIRAANLAHQGMILPALWEAMGAISRVLLSLKEFEASARLMESIMPQVFECEDCNLAAQSFANLADAHMGLAGEAPDDSLQRKEHLTQALGYIDGAFKHFSNIEAVRGQCEMMAKKATIMHLMGDPDLANDCAAKYLAIKRAAKEIV